MKKVFTFCRTENCSTWLGTIHTHTHTHTHTHIYKDEYLTLIFHDFYFFHYSWFTVFRHFSTVQHGDPVTHTCIDSSQVIRHSS